MPVPSIPPFPDDVPVVPLLVIDYKRIVERDEAEIDRLWEAATKLGFWYLKNHGVDEEVDGMFDMGAETMSLPLEEKLKFKQGDEGVAISFGYKAAGSTATDSTGAPDFVEFINISRDDALSYPVPTHRTYPSTVENRMFGTIKPFIEKSNEVNDTLIDVLNDRLGLPKGALAKRHDVREPSGSEGRAIRNPPNQAYTAEKAVLGSHTDFGSLVLPPGSKQWKYVKPVPGHAICNIGDTLAIFSGGILRSNIHRVVPPPKDQAAFERWSVVFFTRPGEGQLLTPLASESIMIAEAAAARPELTTNATAGEWYVRRITNQRLKNRKGPETWALSRGTEYDPENDEVY
ncbi:Clavaminate synthase-like protein [Peniophora sp. CONT]|nr:Clavaminate synthase-like protein [Peniophora sp. CONT]